MRFLVFSLILLFVTDINAYKNGAPSTACKSMTPNHGDHVPSAEPSPYSINVTSDTFNEDQGLKIKIEGGPFKGILLKSVNENGEDLGFFASMAMTLKRASCGKSFVTHQDNSPKDNDTLMEWFYIGEKPAKSVKFVATVVKNHSTFWTNVESKMIPYKSEFDEERTTVMKKIERCFGSTNVKNDIFDKTLEIGSESIFLLESQITEGIYKTSVFKATQSGMITFYLFKLTEEGAYKVASAHSEHHIVGQYVTIPFNETVNKDYRAGLGFTGISKVDYKGSSTVYLIADGIATSPKVGEIVTFSRSKSMELPFAACFEIEIMEDQGSPADDEPVVECIGPEDVKSDDGFTVVYQNPFTFLFGYKLPYGVLKQVEMYVSDVGTISAYFLEKYDNYFYKVVNVKSQPILTIGYMNVPVDIELLPDSYFAFSCHDNGNFPLKLRKSEEFTLQTNILYKSSLAVGSKVFFQDTIKMEFPVRVCIEVNADLPPHIETDNRDIIADNDISDNPGGFCPSVHTIPLAGYILLPVAAMINI